MVHCLDIRKQQKQKSNKRGQQVESVTSYAHIIWIDTTKHVLYSPSGISFSLLFCFIVYVLFCFFILLAADELRANLTGTFIWQRSVMIWDCPKETRKICINTLKFNLRKGRRLSKHLSDDKGRLNELIAFHRSFHANEFVVIIIVSK